MAQNTYVNMAQKAILLHTFEVQLFRLRVWGLGLRLTDAGFQARGLGLPLVEAL